MTLARYEAAARRIESQARCATIDARPGISRRYRIALNRIMRCAKAIFAANVAAEASR
jgi:hypothetical protein